jgi:hypothetical protein
MMNDLKNTKLNPHFVTGFIDGEGCMQVNLTKSKTKIGWAVQATMSLELHRKDLPLLKSIQLFFTPPPKPPGGVGGGGGWCRKYFLREY